MDDTYPAPHSEPTPEREAELARLQKRDRRYMVRTMISSGLLLGGVFFSQTKYNTSLTTERWSEAAVTIGGVVAASTVVLGMRNKTQLDKVTEEIQQLETDPFRAIVSSIERDVSLETYVLRGYDDHFQKMTPPPDTAGTQ